eukprot:1274840-Alexandrium_andersonii.AAC.1
MSPSRPAAASVRRRFCSFPGLGLWQYFCCRGGRGVFISLGHRPSLGVHTAGRRGGRSGGVGLGRIRLL